MLVNAGLAVGLAPVHRLYRRRHWHHVAGWAMLALLWWGARDMGDAAQFDARAKSRFGRIILASAIMGAALWLGERYLLAPFLAADSGAKYLGLFLLCLFGMVVYAIAGIAARAFTMADLKATFRR